LIASDTVLAARVCKSVMQSYVTYKFLILAYLSIETDCFAYGCFIIVMHKI